MKQRIDAIREHFLFAALVGIAMSLFAGCDKQELILADCETYPPGVTTTLIGRTEWGLFYELGKVLVRYEDHIRESRISSASENVVPIPSVNDFFMKKGYTPKVLWYTPDVSNEIIYVGEGVDVMPMLEDLDRVSGVKGVDVLSIYRVSDEIYESQTVDDPWGGGLPSVPRALIEVGKTSEGLLYYLGAIVVRYHNGAVTFHGNAASAASTAVHNFFLDRGYSPEKRLVHVDVEVIQIDPCADIMALLTDLKAIPGVADAQLDVLRTLDERYRGELKILEDLE